MKQKGFTLIELIVVMAVFLVIIGAALGIFISIVQNQKRILARQELLNQASYFLEQMSKGMRMAAKDLTGRCIDQGNVYKITKDANGNFSSIKFINQSDVTKDPQGSCQMFCLSEDIIKEKYPDSVSDWNCLNATPVTSSALKVNSLRFALDGDSTLNQTYSPVEGSNVQPSCTISLDIKSFTSDPFIKVQTTVSQRDLNK